MTLIDPAGERYAHFLFDLARYVLHSLEQLGHDCTLERNRCDPSAINVLVGTHLLRTETDVDRLLGGASDYVVFQTEIMEDRALNGNDVGDRLERVVFPLLRGARAVWDTLDQNLEVLARHGVRGEILQLGYCSRLEDITPKVTRDIDFLFYGSVGTWRRGILQKLDALGYRVRVEFDAVSLYRNDLIARSEIILTLRHGGGMSHLPQGRIVYAVNNGCLVVGEGGAGQGPIEDLFVWTNEPDHVVDLCRQMRAQKDRRELARVFYERLRERPMTGFLAPLVARLDAAVKTERAA